MDTTFPPHEPGRHGSAALLTLVGAVRRLAFDRTLPPPEALGRIRDAYRDYRRSTISQDARLAPIHHAHRRVYLRSKSACESPSSGPSANV